MPSRDREIARSALGSSIPEQAAWLRPVPSSCPLSRPAERRLRACVGADAGDYAVRDHYRSTFPPVLSFETFSRRSTGRRGVTGVTLSKGKEEEAPCRAEQQEQQSPNLAKIVRPAKLIQHHPYNSFIGPTSFDNWFRVHLGRTLSLTRVPKRRICVHSRAYHSKHYTPRFR